MSEIFPHVGSVVDDICIIRSMVTDIPNHEPSLLMMNTGHTQPGRPSMGAWLTYGLGRDNENLPGFVVLCPDQNAVVGPPLWGNSFLPAVNQGTFISDKEADVSLQRPRLSPHRRPRKPGSRHPEDLIKAPWNRDRGR